MNRNIEILLKWVASKEELDELSHELSKLELPKKSKIDLANSPLELDVMQLGETCALFYKLISPEKFVQIYNEFIEKMHTEVDIHIESCEDVLDNCTVNFKGIKS